MSKLEYLKKYLSGPKKVKKKVPSNASRRFRIIDDDIGVKQLIPKDAADADDDAPIIAEVVDERPEIIRELDRFKSKPSWRTFGATDAEKAVKKEPEVLDLDTVKTGEKMPKRLVDKLIKREPSSPSSKRKRRKKRTRHDSDESDLSPDRPADARGSNEADLSPLRDADVKREPLSDRDGDLSSARGNDMEKSAASSTQIKQEKTSPSSSSPAARKERHHRKHKHRHHHRKSRSTSPTKRRRHDSDPDMSPPRKNPPDEKLTKTLDGKKAGLSTGDEVMKEAVKIRKTEDELFQRLDTSISGKDALTIYRDKLSGRKRDMEQEKMEENEKKKVEEERLAEYQRIGKGLVQNLEREQNIADAMHEVSKPLARYRDDADLDKMRREELRMEDPMLKFLSKKQDDSGPKNDDGRPRYRGPPPPPNRYEIPPGHRWDGVDRSNGFEKKLFTKRADQATFDEEAYKWGVEDM